MAGQAAQGGASATACDHPDYHGRGWRKEAGAVTSTSKAKHSIASSGGRAADARGESGSESEEDNVARLGAGVASESESEEGRGGPIVPAAASFKPLPPPRIRLQPVQVNFTKLETGHLPAREHREVCVERGESRRSLRFRTHMEVGFARKGDRTDSRLSVCSNANIQAVSVGKAPVCVREYFI